MTESSPSPAEIIIAERQLEAMKMRKEGWSYRDIGDHLGISDDTARRDVITALQAIQWTRDEQAVEVREMAMNRNHDAIKAIYERVLSGDVGAIDRLIRLNEQLLDIVGGRTANLDLTSGGAKLEAPINTIEVLLTHGGPGTAGALPDGKATDPL